MAKAIKTLSANLAGRRFQTDEGTEFQVVVGDHFPDSRIGRQHYRYLSSLRTGLLVSATFYGQPVPLIKVDDGVVRLVEVEVDGELVKGSATISERLGVTETRQPVGLFR